MTNTPPALDAHIERTIATWRAHRGGSGRPLGPVTAWRKVISEDLDTAGIVLPDGEIRRVAADIAVAMPENPHEINEWDADRWRPILDHARQLAAGRAQLIAQLRVDNA